MILTVGSFSSIPIQDQSGQVHTIQIDEGGLIFMALLKMVCNALFIKWGIMALKTFKPIVKDIHRQEI